ncbi:tetratricopeptide repeat protein [Desulfobaculum sp.]
MHKFSTLLKDQPSIHESRMSSKGYAVWMVWSGELSSAIPSTFRDFGGMEVSTAENQSLWFFFTTDVFLAMGRLQVWATLNVLPVFIQVMPTSMQVGFQLEQALSIPSDLFGQQTMPPDDFQVLVHPDLRAVVESIPGITLEDYDRNITGMAAASWKLLHGDPRIGFKSSLGWYFILKPLGNPQDKKFMEGWRAYFAEVEGILKRLKLKYIIKDEFLIFSLENFGALKTWCKEILNLVQQVKSNDDLAYWPTVMAAVDKAGYQFNEELPKKVAVDWDKMAPDFPHMSYATAFMLGEPFKIKDVSYSFERSRFSDWCYVHMLTDGEEGASGSLPMVMPVGMLAGEEHPCFYCGMRNHTEAECPSKSLVSMDAEVWKVLAHMDLDEMNEALAQAGSQIKDDAVAMLPQLLNGKDAASHVTKVIYEMHAPSQLRMVPLIWRSLGKELPSGLNKLAPPESTTPIRALTLLQEGDAAQAERMAKEGALRNPRDYQYRTLQGFLALERGEIERAISFWKDAELLGETSLQYAYHKYLQGRGYEVLGNFDKAMALYKEAGAMCPRWVELRYRQSACLVKMGFSEHVVGLLDDMVDENPHIFNRILVDPEMERGHVQIMSSLWDRWVMAEEGAKDALEKLSQLSEELDDWFGKDKDFNKEMQHQTSVLMELDGTNNFVVFTRIIKGRMQLARKLKNKINAEIKFLEKQGKTFRERLKTINDEISWFPFPRALREFNKDFNFCVTKLNWIHQQHFQVARNFRKSHEYLDEVEQKLNRLGMRLVTLKIVRDSTLFALILSKGFMWLEIICLGLALILVPAAVYVAEVRDMNWLRELIQGQRWALQKGLVIILSVVALILATLRTAIIFEKRKKELFERAKGQS